VSRPKYNQEPDTDNSTTQASQNTSVGTPFPFFINKPEEKVSRPKYIEKPNTEIAAWQSPESISDLVIMLENCEDSETLRLIRQCDVPSDIFKLAARQLPEEKRERIRLWVIEQNAESA